MNPSTYISRSRRFGMNKLYYRLTDPSGTWVCSSMQVDPTPEQTLARVQRAAQQRGLPVKYELIDKETYLKERRL